VLQYGEINAPVESVEIARLGVEGAWYRWQEYNTRRGRDQTRGQDMSP